MRSSLSPSGVVRLCLFITINGLLVGCLMHSKESPATAKPSAPSAILSAASPATQPVDPVLARIRDEGLLHSKAPESIDYLCNVIGHRLTGSPSLRTAAGWARDSLTSWGLSNAE